MENRTFCFIFVIFVAYFCFYEEFKGEWFLFYVALDEFIFFFRENVVFILII